MQKPEDPGAEPMGFPIVGIGASAGGLEAFQKFFEATPKDTGMAFVLVAHLDRSHVSFLPELVQRQTEMPVRAVEHGVVVRPNQVYVIPPNRGLTLSGGVLHLAKISEPRGSNLPIDSFFRSLAEDRGTNAACVILSGTGSDGTLGLRAIKEKGGLVVIQTGASAKHDGMPRSALATGLADYVLPPEEMGSRILGYFRHTVPRILSEDVEGTAAARNPVETILRFLRAKTGHDFTQYKMATITRRLQRRLRLHQIDDLAEYGRFLRKSEREVGILFRELLIGVTSFFRDPLAFEALRERVLPRLLKQDLTGRPFRVWVPGCSTGEEAYSIAMILQEAMEARRERFRAQIFATDLDGDAVALARTGRYPAGIRKDVGEERLQRHFSVEDDGHFRIRKHLREMVAFAVQNVIKDPPFMKLDLISCRNLLIYLGPELQGRVIPMFHFALNPGGLLFLGTSETVGRPDGLFKTEDKKWKIYRRGEVTSGQGRVLVFPQQGAGPVKGPEFQPDKVKVDEELETVNVLEAILKQGDTPPCAVVDAERKIVFVHGRVGRYLEPAEGKPTLDILAMARHGLRKALTEALLEGARTRRNVSVPEVRVRHDGGYLRVALKVRPILGPGSLQGLLIVSFRELPSPAKETGGKEGKPGGIEAGEVEDLRLELQMAKEDLQTSLEEMGTSNEELQSANEELQSANEELQSSYEELETSQEELQSLHEEAETVNAELQARIDELAAVNDDLKNLLDSTQIATLFLDIDLRVRRFTPFAAKFLPIEGTDVGRPISDLAPHLENVDLAAHARGVLETLTPAQAQVKGKSGLEYLLRVTPYRTANNVIDGVVMTFQERGG